MTDFPLYRKQNHRIVSGLGFFADLRSFVLLESADNYLSAITIAARLIVAL